jgi:hypothetical protein
MLFNDILKTQLILTGVITEQDWVELKEHIQYKFAQDQYFEEMKEAENLRNRIDLVNQMQPFVGTYFSKAYIMKSVLRFTDEEIETMEAQMEEEPSPTIGVDGQPVQPPINNQTE